MLTGLVDMRRSVPPKGATIMPSPLVLTKWIEMRPLAAASSAQSPMRPRWPELRRPTTETPYSRALSAASVNRLLADGLAEAVVAVEHRDRAGVHHRLHVPACAHRAASSQYT